MCTFTLKTGCPFVYKLKLTMTGSQKVSFNLSKCKVGCQLLSVEIKDTSMVVHHNIQKKKVKTVRPSKYLIGN